MSATPPVRHLPGHRDLTPLGRGGFSEVYQAYQEQFDRWVAVKVLTVPLTDERARNRFLRECRVAGRLSSHPNIISVYDAGITPDGLPYISMELLARGSIADALTAGGPFPVADTLRIGVALAGALETAHRAGVVHRDVKPANVLMTSYGQPVLADFGLSVIAERADVSAATDAFTPYHAPPEVLERQTATPAADVYSLASTLYTMLAGRPAHQRGRDESIASLLLRILQEEVPPVPRRDLPPSLAGTLTAALARDVADRTSGPMALARGLSRALEEMGETAVAPVIIEPGTSAPAAEHPTPPGDPTAALLVDTPRTTVRRDRAWDLPAEDPRSPVPPAPVAGAAPAAPRHGESAGHAAGLADRAFGFEPPPGDATVQRAPGASPRPAGTSAGGGRRGRRRARTALLAGAVAGVGLAGGALAWSVAGDPGPSGGPPEAAEATTTTAGREPAIPVPVNVTAAESAAGVQLDWEGEDGGEFVVLVLSDAESPRFVAPPDGRSLLIPAASLEPEAGYCFSVAYVDAVARAPEDGAETAFSAPVCIRGATGDSVRPA